MEKVRCNLCDSDKFTEVYTLQDYLLERPNILTTLVQCDNCGLIYQNPRPSAVEMDQHYPDEYEPYENLGESKKTWLLRKAIEYGLAKRAKFVTKHRKTGRLLDVGCATGEFLSAMRLQEDWELYGVEPNARVASIASHNTGANVFIGTLEQAQFAKDYFDVVTMWDVLEHVYNPQKTLDEIFRILKPDGLLIIRVPNGSSFQAKIFGKFWAGLDAPRHLYVFSLKTLSTMLSRSGFEIVDSSFNSASYLILVLSFRFWMVDRGIKKTIQERVLKILNHPISRLISAPWFYIAGFFVRGPSMIVTARRSR